ncbi:phosphopeptide-binding protein [Sorangium cellulosum]|uniref:Phosphopeptide-binding protein n=1 Tax=Sorangium cellulosum TaxID=56 RepID=A0A2L0EIQ8_SORCE|nr:FHA domain-containing protein [Sorangium cellulosum]AUX39185.1 phosphopeptide-binding protein [Sorangium cellulosum]
MITCPKCSKDNQDHYKFCLGCGAELPRDVSPKKFAAGTPPHGVPAAVRSNMSFGDEPTAIGTGAAKGAPVATPPPPALVDPAAFSVPVRGEDTGAGRKAAAAGAAAAPTGPTTTAATGGAGTVVCPQCQEPNPPTNKFCALCGFKLVKPASPPAQAPAPVVPAPAGNVTVVLTALRADGTEAGAYTLPGSPTTIGREAGSIFAGDSYLSPRHATFSIKGGKLFVKDESSLNGVYRRLRRDAPVPLDSGDIFRIGQELIRVEALAPAPATPDGVERLGSPSKGYVARLALIIGRDATGNAFPVPDTGLHLGRERGDILFPEDGYVSGLHCQIAYQGGRLLLTDLGSSNGTFFRVLGETEITNGDILLMGQQLFRISV